MKSSLSRTLSLSLARSRSLCFPSSLSVVCVVKCIWTHTPALSDASLYVYAYEKVELALGASMAQAGIMMESVDMQPEFATRKCRNHLDFLMCYFCSPLQKGWTDSNGKVCLSACVLVCVCANAKFLTCSITRQAGDCLPRLLQSGTLRLSTRKLERHRDRGPLCQRQSSVRSAEFRGAGGRD
jgi:hypothetical protein